MSWADAFARGRAHRLRLAARPRHGVAGQHFGTGTGASLEFQEFRDYQVGDDLRRIDWRSYARTEQLHTRLHREEVSASVELVLDGSRSMELTPEKAAATRGLAAFLGGAASSDHHLRPLLAGDPLRPLPAACFADPGLPAVDFHGERSLSELPLSGLLRPGSVRIVLSDFLFPHDPAALVARLARGASDLLLVALLDEHELDPGSRGSLRLTEAESGRQRDLAVDDAAVARYRERLDRLWQGLLREVQRRGGTAVRGDTRLALADWIADVLHPAGVIEVR